MTTRKPLGRSAKLQNLRKTCTTDNGSLRPPSISEKGLAELDKRNCLPIYKITGDERHEKYPIYFRDTKKTRETLTARIEAYRGGRGPNSYWPSMEFRYSPSKEAVTSVCLDNSRRTRYIPSQPDQDRCCDCDMDSECSQCGCAIDGHECFHEERCNNTIIRDGVFPAIYIQHTGHDKIGLGLRAAETIKGGDVITPYYGTICSPQVFGGQGANNYTMDVKSNYLVPGKTMYVDPVPEGGAGSFTNDPGRDDLANAEFQSVEVCREVVKFIQAKHDIKADEWITANYGENYFTIVGFKREETNYKPEEEADVNAENSEKMVKNPKKSSGKNPEKTTSGKNPKNTAEKHSEKTGSGTNPKKATRKNQKTNPAKQQGQGKKPPDLDPPDLDLPDLDPPDLDPPDLDPPDLDPPDFDPPGINVLEDVDISHWPQSPNDRNEYKLYRSILPGPTNGALFMGISGRGSLTNENASFASAEEYDKVLAEKINDFDKSPYKYGRDVMGEDTNGPSSKDVFLAVSINEGLMSKMIPTTVLVPTPHLLEHGVVDIFKKLFDSNDVHAATYFEQTVYRMTAKSLGKANKYLADLVFGSGGGVKKSKSAHPKTVFERVDELIVDKSGQKTNNEEWRKGLTMQLLQIQNEWRTKSVNHWVEFEIFLQLCAAENHPVYGFNGSCMDERLENGLPEHLAYIQSFFRSAYYNNVGEGVFVAFANVPSKDIRKMFEDVVRTSRPMPQKASSSISSGNKTAERLRNKIPFKQSMLKSAILLASVDDKTRIVLRLPLETMFGMHILSSPLRYVLSCLDFRGKGSLYSALARNGLIRKLEVQANQCSFVTVVTLTLTLTIKGVREWRTVLQTTFAYLAWFHKSRPSPDFYAQLKALQSIYFHHYMDMTTLRFVEMVAMSLHFFRVKQWPRPPDILYSTAVMQKYDEGLIAGLQSLFRPDKFFITITHPPENEGKEHNPDIAEKLNVKPLGQVLSDQTVRCYDLQFRKVQRSVLLETVSKAIQISPNNNDKLFDLPNISNISSLTDLTCPVLTSKGRLADWIGQDCSSGENQQEPKNCRVDDEEHVHLNLYKSTKASLETVHHVKYISCHIKGNIPKARYRVSFVCESAADLGLKNLDSPEMQDYYLQLWTHVMNTCLCPVPLSSPSEELECGLPDGMEGSTIPEFAVTQSTQLSSEKYGILMAVEGAPRYLHLCFMELLQRALDLLLARGSSSDRAELEGLVSGYYSNRRNELFVNDEYCELLSEFILYQDEPLLFKGDQLPTITDFKTFVKKFLDECELVIQLDGCVTRSQGEYVKTEIQRLEKKVFREIIKKSLQPPATETDSNMILMRQRKIITRKNLRKKIQFNFLSRNPADKISVLKNVYVFKRSDRQKIKNNMKHIRYDIEKYRNRFHTSYSVKMSVIGGENDSDEYAFLTTTYTPSTKCNGKRKYKEELNVVEIDELEEVAIQEQHKKIVSLMIAKLSIRVHSSCPDHGWSGPPVLMHKDPDTGITYLQIPSEDTNKATNEMRTLDPKWEPILGKYTILANGTNVTCESWSSL